AGAVAGHVLRPGGGRGDSGAPEPLVETDSPRVAAERAAALLRRAGLPALLPAAPGAGGPGLAGRGAAPAPRDLPEAGPAAGRAHSRLAQQSGGRGLPGG